MRGWGEGVSQVAEFPHTLRELGFPIGGRVAKLRPPSEVDDPPVGQGKFTRGGIQGTLRSFLTKYVEVR